MHGDPWQAAWQQFFLWQQQYQPQEYLLACSGGADSMALLQQLSALKPRLSAPLRVMYIDHGWHAQAQQWGETVAAAAQARGFACERLALQIDKSANAEARAREARYAAFARALAPRGVLLTAHQQDDQAETFLLNLLRGSGIEGLSAMPGRKAFARGEHWRPLLNISRVEIERYIACQGIETVHDDSNEDRRYRRNWLRHEILPRLRQSYPQASAAIARSAQHLAEVRRWQEEYLEAQLAGSGDCLALAQLQQHALPRQAMLLRHWLRRQGLALPPRARLQEWLRQLAGAAASAVLEYGDVLLYCQGGHIAHLPRRPPAAPPPFAAITDWQGIGELSVTAGAALLAGRDCRWALYPPGQRFRPEGKHYSKPLKEWLRLAGIAPPLRRRLPLLWVDGELAWVGGLGAAQAFAGLVLLWHKKPYSDTIAR